jgi:choline dehydrogenase-like flavoprotein
MIIDSRSLPSSEILKTDVCIIGAGPAGITLAKEFTDQNFKVYLLESGGLEYDSEIQALNVGSVIGDNYPSLSDTRIRQLGGTSHAWEGQNGPNEYGFRCLPLDKIDFEQRDWLPHSGWPFLKAHLDPFYERAHKVCQIGSYTYDIEDWESKRAVRLPLNKDRITTSISQFAPRRPFTEQYKNEINQSKNITTFIHASVIGIETNEEADTVTCVHVASSKDHRFSLKARLFILATGGLENARILLSSNHKEAGGLGNRNDLVGRYFMDRPILSSIFKPSTKKLFHQTSLYDIYRTKGSLIMAGFQLSEDLVRSKHLLNNGAQIFPRPLVHQKEATIALRSLLSSDQLRKSSWKGVFKDLDVILRASDYITYAGFWAILRQLPGMRRGSWSYLPYEKSRFSQFEVFYQLEQAPDPNNRVKLSFERDYLGQNKIELHWRLNSIDINNAIKVQEIWAEEFRSAGLGEFKFEREQKNWKFEKPAMHHHMGATRMHNDPKQGVVDANCKVHGITNLFIAGSSIFPTSGYANPTLTIIALSLRLADHIKLLMSKA